MGSYIGKLYCMEFQALHSNFSSSLSIIVTTRVLYCLVLLLNPFNLHNGRVSRYELVWA